MKKSHNLKAIGKILVLTAVILIYSSCEEQLEENLYSYYAAEQFFNTVKQADMAVMSVYGCFDEYQVYGLNITTLWFVDTDIMKMRNADAAGVYRYNAEPTDAALLSAWSSYYQAIYRANLAIEKIPQMDLYNNGTDIEKTELKRLQGEALFLRGLAYFDLIRFWGDVPFVIKNLTVADDLKLPRTDREIIYNQIFEDLTLAGELVPWLSEVDEVNERATKGAVKGIFARICLYRGGYSLRQEGIMKRPDNYSENYQKAKELLNDIIQSGEHALNPSFESIFKNQCQQIYEPKENLYEIAFYDPSGGNAHNGTIGSTNSVVVHANSIYGRGQQRDQLIPIFAESYVEDDQRKSVTVADWQIDANNKIVKWSASNDDKWSNGKWRRNWHILPYRNINSTDVNFPLLRYADVLLMYAEAENEINGPTESAYRAVNQVRRRAFGKALDVADPVCDVPAGLSKEDFFNFLKTERAKELCGECWRRWDLIRWNIIGPVLRDTQAKLKARRSNFPYVAGDTFNENKDELFPIPQRERDENPNLTQNPGY